MADNTFASHEASVRLMAFAIILALLVLWEHRAAVPAGRISPARRWSSNYGMGLLDTLILRLFFPAGAVTAAMVAARQHMGLFTYLSFTGYGELVVSFLLLDLTIYAQHRLFHALPWLWRIHRVHHADPEIDVSTALRFHPLESVLSMLLKAGAVVSFGMSASAVLAFEIVLNAAAMFTHTNVCIPRRWGRWIRFVIVTPDMHRFHHSTDIANASRNFAFCVSWWDRLFGSYRAPDRAPFPSSIGLPDAPFALEHVRLPWMLLMPFRR
jgi:sterol desaturase/sphingolipid hydroxylase (fatty acid hydroxylase superfamily)